MDLSSLLPGLPTGTLKNSFWWNMIYKIVGKQVQAVQMTLISTELEVKNTVKTFYRDVKYYKTTL